MNQTACKADAFWLLTPWTFMGKAEPPDEATGTMEEAERRDGLFRAMVLEKINAGYPFLIDVLRNSGCNILARPGAVKIVTPAGTEHLIHDVSLASTLVPWRDAGQTPN